jgi:hypothetical protein
MFWLRLFTLIFVSWIAVILSQAATTAVIKMYQQGLPQWTASSTTSSPPTR